MHLAVFLLSALAASLAAAAPSLLMQRQDYCAGGKSAGYCTPISYNDVTSSASSSAPSSSDCQNTCQSILSDAGDWGVDFTGQPAGYRDQMYLGTCGFAIARETDNDTSQFSFLVLNEDIVGLVGESINRFANQHNGKVKAEGTMNCTGHVVRWFVG